MSTIIHKKSSVAGKVPVAGDLQYGELAINYADAKIYLKKSDNTIVGISEAGTGTQTNDFAVQMAIALG